MSEFNRDENEDNERDLPQYTTKFCVECGSKIRSKASMCPKCGVRQSIYEEDEDEDEGRRNYRRSDREYSGSKVAAGICGIQLGSLGIHKFILGLNTPGLIMLLVSLLTCGFGAIPMSIIGLIEGVIYLTKSDRDFYRTYVRGKKEWF